MPEDELEQIVEGTEPTIQGYVDNGLVPQVPIQTATELSRGTANQTTASIFGGEVITEKVFYEQYKVIKYLGSGGQGKVIRVKNQNYEKVYTIKKIPLHDDDFQKTMTEARALQNLDNPHIQKLYHFYHVTETRDIADELYLVLEDFEGESLAKRFEREERATEEQINAIDAQCLEALTAAHAKGIIHRDLKPDNILINPEGYVKVIDFGLAKFLGEATRESSAGKGSIAYMAPEQMRRSQLAGSKLYPSTDYYSLALIDLDLARGSARVDNPAIGQTIEEDLTNMTHLSEKFKAKIRAMTHENPLQRTNGLEEVVEEEAATQNISAAVTQDTTLVRDLIPFHNAVEELRRRYSKNYSTIDQLITVIYDDKQLLKFAEIVGERKVFGFDNDSYLSLDENGLLYVLYVYKTHDKNYPNGLVNVRINTKEGRSDPLHPRTVETLEPRKLSNAVLRYISDVVLQSDDCKESLAVEYNPKSITQPELLPVNAALQRLHDKYEQRDVTDLRQFLTDINDDKLLLRVLGLTGEKHLFELGSTSTDTDNLYIGKDGLVIVVKSTDIVSGYSHIKMPDKRRIKLDNAFVNNAYTYGIGNFDTNSVMRYDRVRSIQADNLKTALLQYISDVQSHPEQYDLVKLLETEKIAEHGIVAIKENKTLLGMLTGAIVGFGVGYVISDQTGIPHDFDYALQAVSAVYGGMANGLAVAKGKYGELGLRIKYGFRRLFNTKAYREREEERKILDDIHLSGTVVDRIGNYNPSTSQPDDQIHTRGLESIIDLTRDKQKIISYSIVDTTNDKYIIGSEINQFKKKDEI